MRESYGIASWKVNSLINKNPAYEKNNDSFLGTMDVYMPSIGPTTYYLVST